MSAGIHALVTEALALPEASRAFLAEKLLESLDQDEDLAVSDEWRDEIRRRCRDLDEGKSRTTSAEEVFAELRQQLG
jgi:putative addiction module component (TIGR02574 family)